MGEIFNGQLNLNRTPLVGQFIQPIENGLSSIGVRTPTSRFALFGASTALALWMIKPTMYFSEDGEARPFAPWVDYEDPDYDGDAEETYMPWWAVSALVGVAGAVFL